MIPEGQLKVVAVELACVVTEVEMFGLASDWRQVDRRGRDGLVGRELDPD